MISHDPRDLGIQIPKEWYQSPRWRLEMQKNAKATLDGDVSWVDRKFEEYRGKNNPANHLTQSKRQAIIYPSAKGNSRQGRQDEHIARNSITRHH